MMQIICSGLGGQGVLTLGLILAEIAADQGKFVTWIPSYGSEMRGGVANCTMKISDTEIISPYIEEMDLLVALSPTAVEKFKDKVKPGGCIIGNSSTVKDTPQKEGVKVLEVPATEIALAESNTRGMGLAIIGAIIAHSGIVSQETGADGVDAYFAKKEINNPKNRAVFLAGYAAAAKKLAEA